MRHVGEELRLMATRSFQLTALLLDFAEQPRVLDGEGRLGRECAQQVDYLGGEFAGLVAGHTETADQMALTNHRYGEDRPDAGVNEDVSEPSLIGARHSDVCHLNGFQRHSCAPEHPLSLSNP